MKINDQWQITSGPAGVFPQCGGDWLKHKDGPAQVLADV